MSSATLLVVYWEWPDGPNQGARFWAAHHRHNDGRLNDWPVTMGLRPLAAAEVTVVEGEGLGLLGHFPELARAGGHPETQPQETVP